MLCNEDVKTDNAEIGQIKSVEHRMKKIYNVEWSLVADEEVTRFGKLVKFYE